MKIKVMLDSKAVMPERAHSTDAGLDLKTPHWFEVDPGESYTVDTGVHVQIPVGYAGFIKSKSGLNVKFGLTTDGVIDSGYTGSIRVKIYNHSEYSYEFQKGDKITQLCIVPVMIPDEIEIVDSFEETERGTGGFGSSGR